MTGKEALWEQAKETCVEDYGIVTEVSRSRSADCEWGGVWDCQECWESETVNRNA